ncbi:MAG: branched-chain amino acid aminotransferase [Faecousia sp.]
MDIRITRTDTPGCLPEDVLHVHFGVNFTDHMFVVDYTGGQWHDARIEPLSCFQMHPACAVFHYGTEIFEGLKAYRTPGGEIQLFRPRDNIARLNNSAERMGLPRIDPDFLLEALRTFVKVEERWVPSQPGTSLYLRPVMICTDVHLGVHGAENAMLYIIASPVGSYYPNGLEPVRIMIEQEDVRAVRGGTGYAKCGGNYAASNRATVKAAKLGYDQVLWLDGVERKYIEEVGAMNVMFKIGGRVITPSLTGSILPGITRSTCITLLREQGIIVEERRLSVEELTAAAENGTLEEAWGCGTAAVISPIGVLAYAGRDHWIGGGKIGAVSRMLYEQITSIQYGRSADPHGWICPVK